MKLKIINPDGKESGQQEMPVQFKEPCRKDLIKKAVLAIQNNKRQAYGAYPEAGMRHSADLSRRRRKYRGSYGHGISRVQRKILSRRGTQMYWVGAVIPGTVGGRRAHPPKSGKQWAWKLNTKEKRKAICSALSASINKELVKSRGHIIPDSYPFVAGESFEKISATKELLKALASMGFEEELKRAGRTGLRSGRGKARGRKKKAPKSLLIVAADAARLRKAASNIPGIDVINIKRLNAESLAPGATPGRASIFTLPAVKVLAEGLFTNNYKPGAKAEKKSPARTRKKHRGGSKSKAKPINKSKPKTEPKPKPEAKK